MSLSLDLDDAMSHNWIVGSNGAGKSNLTTLRVRAHLAGRPNLRGCLVR